MVSTRRVFGFGIWGGLGFRFFGFGIWGGLGFRVPGFSDLGFGVV